MLKELECKTCVPEHNPEENAWKTMWMDSKPMQKNFFKKIDFPFYSLVNGMAIFNI